MGRALPDCINNNSNYTNGISDGEHFKVAMDKSLNRQENTMKKDSDSKLEWVYEVGEYCGVEGRMWSVLVNDNKDALKNIKGVLQEHYQQELDILLGA